MPITYLLNPSPTCFSTLLTLSLLFFIFPLYFSLPSKPFSHIPFQDLYLLHIFYITFNTFYHLFYTTFILLYFFYILYLHILYIFFYIIHQIMLFLFFLLPLFPYYSLFSPTLEHTHFMIYTYITMSYIDNTKYITDIDLSLDDVSEYLFYTLHLTLSKFLPSLSYVSPYIKEEEPYKEDSHPIYSFIHLLLTSLIKDKLFPIPIKFLLSEREQLYKKQVMSYTCHSSLDISYSYYNKVISSICNISTISNTSCLYIRNTIYPNIEEYYV